jgi:glycosyltransferase involved in cell wall biosynthesis
LPPVDHSQYAPVALEQLRSEFPRGTDALQQAVRERVAAGPASPRRAMRVLHVITSLSPADGGPPEMLKQLAGNYRALGDHLEVASLDMPDAPYLKEVRFTVHALGPRLGSYGYSTKLQHWLNAARFDLIVINNVWLFPAVAAWRAARRAQVPYAVFTHGTLDVFFKKRYPLKHLKKLLYWPLQYTILRSAAAVLFTSELERELALASFRPNGWTSVVLPYGTNEPDGDPGPQREAFYAVVPSMRDRRFLLFLSRIHEKKGCDLLIEAFAKLAPLYTDVDLVVAGPDQMLLQARLQQQAGKAHVGDRIHWPGMLEGAAKFGAFRAAEAFVLPSHQENFGIVVAESLACGTPVLISNQVNIWREILDSSVGLVEPDTLEGTLDLLRRWLDLSEDERKRMAGAALDTFHQRFSLRRTAESVHALFEVLHNK